MASTVLIDDTNSQIMYGTGWSIVEGASLRAENSHGIDEVNGRPFRGTLHKMTEGGDFFFRFNGSSVSVIGASSSLQSSGLNYSCFVDQKSIPTHAPSTSLGLTTAWPICDVFNLTEGGHELTVNVTSTMPFYLDYVAYTPLADAEVERVDTLRVDNPNLAIRLSDGWTDYQDFSNTTFVPGSKATFVFHGEAVTWYGSIAQEFPTAQSSASFSIDGGAPTAFHLNGSSEDLHNVEFFTTQTLPPGRHTLEVIHNGNAASVPLSLDFIYVQSALVPQASLSDPDEPLPPDIVPGPSTSSNGTTSGPLPLSAIIGVTVGGALLLAILFFALFLWRYQRRKQRKAARQSILTASEEGYCLPNLPQRNRREAPSAPPLANATLTYIKTNSKSTLKSKASSVLNPLNTDVRPTTSTSVTSTAAVYSGSPTTPSPAHPLRISEANSTHFHPLASSQPHRLVHSRNQNETQLIPTVTTRTSTRTLKVVNGDPVLDEDSTDGDLDRL